MSEIDVSFLDHPLIGETGFFPRPDAPDQIFSVAVEGATLGCWYEERVPGGRTVVFFHGNGETVADYAGIFPDIFEGLGCNLLLAEYREYGASTGTAGLACMLPDGEAILKAANLRPEETVVFGRSLGAIYAVELVHRVPGIGGLILESGVSRPGEFVRKRATAAQLGVTEERLEAAIADRLDSAAKLGEYTGPLLVLHAEHDTLVPVQNAHNFHDWAAGEDKTRLIFPRGGHNDILALNWDAYWQAVSSFLRG